MKKIPFSKLPKSEQLKIRQSIPLGKVEVNCPWWNANHWEPKNSGEPWEEAYYRIK